MNTVSLDNIDFKIIEILKEDSRKSLREIEMILKEKGVKITHQTISNRIDKMEKSGVIIQYTCMIDDKKLGRDVTTVILVILDRAASVWEFTAKELLSRQKELEIIEMHHLAGQYDVMIKMKTANIETLEKNLTIITSIKGVSRTHTMVCLSSYEYNFEHYTS